MELILLLIIYCSHAELFLDSKGVCLKQLYYLSSLTATEMLLSVAMIIKGTVLEEQHNGIQIDL